jgi:hypothetical protein
MRHMFESQVIFKAEKRTVYEAFPTHSRSWFLKVDTHYDVEVALRLICIALQ